MDAYQPPLTEPASEPSAEDAIAQLRKLGYTVSEPGAANPDDMHDPLKDVDLATVPKAVLDGLGVSREEVERHRDAAPAIEHAHHPQRSL